MDGAHMKIGISEIKIYFFLILTLATFSLNAFAATASYSSSIQLNPEQALQRLIKGNKRFVDNKLIQYNLLQQAKVTSIKGQFPSSLILSCMDSRGSSELIFNQGIGDIFSVRIAGNIIDADQLGGMEYATQVIGTKLIVIMGHTQCGAVAGACKETQLGNLTQLLAKIKPAVHVIKHQSPQHFTCDEVSTIDAIAKQNVIDMMHEVMKHSPLIREKVLHKKVMLAGAMHDLHSGKVVFLIIKVRK
jgi:carbonic anhydrase